MPRVPTTQAELRQEQRKIVTSSALAFMLCAAVLGAAHVFLPRIVNFPAADLESRLTFWAAATLFLLVWVMAGVGMVSNGRFYSAEDNRGSAYSRPSEKIAVKAAFLQNTLEQFIVTTFVLLALIMLLGAPAMPFTAATVALFAIGRITFLRGYPKGAGGRAFGMAVTAIPALIALVLSIGALLIALL